MNYFDHHIGDYDQSTAHLTACEDGIYHRLLRKYYATEKPLPADLATLQRLVRARSKEEKQAVSDVLSEFFTLQADGWHQARCDTVINEYHEKQAGKETEKLNAKERQRRARERRAFLFEQLRAHNIVPPYKTTTAELETMLSRVTHANVTPPATGDNTATQAPYTSTQSPVASKNNLSVEVAAASNAAGGEKTPSVLLLHPFAILLQTLEAARGCEFQAVGREQVFADWEARGVTEAHVRAAHERAVLRRQKDGSTAPVNVGLIDVLLADLLRPAGSAVVALVQQDPKERRHRELQAEYAGEVLTGPDGRRFEVMSNGLVSVFDGIEFKGTLGVEHARAFWDDVDAGIVVPRAA